MSSPGVLRVRTGRPALVLIAAFVLSAIPFARPDVRFGLAVIASLIALVSLPGLLSRVSIDEGGVRIDGPFGLWRRYRSFHDIGELEPRDECLILRDRMGERLETWDLRNVAAMVTVFMNLSERVAACHPVAGSGFERGTSSLGRWLGNIATAVKDLETRGPYRARSLDLERAKALVSDLAAPADVRAGAGFALLASNDARNRSIAANSIKESSPPLLVVAADLACGGLTHRELARRAAAYLSRRDRRDLRRFAQG